MSLPDGMSCQLTLRSSYHFSTAFDVIPSRYPRPPLRESRATHHYGYDRQEARQTPHPETYRHQQNGRELAIDHSAATMTPNA